MNGIGERQNLWSSDPTPSGATDREAPFKDFGSSMNAISFGFVATAILISMFLLMAIFEHLLRPRPSIPPSRNNAHGSLEMDESRAQMQTIGGKLGSSEHVATPQPSDFSVLMPGQLYPTHLAQPAPLPCSREGIYWPSHRRHASGSP